LEMSDSRETLYGLNRDKKDGITGRLFAFSLQDFWNKCLAHEATLKLGDLANARYSPGRVFQLSEWDIRERLEHLEEDSDRAFRFEETALFQRITRMKTLDSSEFLSSIYESEVIRA